MIISDFKDFPRTGRILGVDWGNKRIGLAISTPDRNFVFPYSQLGTRNQEPGTKILEIIKNERIVGVVIGLPTHADGSDSDTTRAVRKFAAGLNIDLPIMFMDERLTSAEAESRKPKADLDSVAASIILEDFIAMQKRNQI
ncbi:MAG: Holliday junction resolvase RuvX [Rickettsiales bacterium]|jgi:putative Holliday junction resolvase|nr:Holliday junction resolvase RuvX [Rickettsiales bacterium]